MTIRKAAAQAIWVCPVTCQRRPPKPPATLIPCPACCGWRVP